MKNGRKTQDSRKTEKGKKIMKEKIRKHINELFKDAPKTRRAVELKEEMAQNTIEKYEDLIGEGYQEEDAFQIVIGSIGDVTELFEDLKDKSLFLLPEEQRRKKAMLTAIAVGLYIFAFVVFILSMVLYDIFWPMSPDGGTLALALTVLICIPPTCMLVYAANMYPVHNKKEENLVELYKEAAHTGSRDKAVRTSISMIIWLVTLLLYFAISMTTQRWEITWLLFLVGACAQTIEVLVFNLRRDG